MEDRKTTAKKLKVLARSKSICNLIEFKELQHHYAVSVTGGNYYLTNWIPLENFPVPTTDFCLCKNDVLDISDYLGTSANFTLQENNLLFKNGIFEKKYKIMDTENMPVNPEDEENNKYLTGTTTSLLIEGIDFLTNYKNARVKSFTDTILFSDNCMYWTDTIVGKRAAIFSDMIQENIYIDDIPAIKLLSKSLKLTDKSAQIDIFLNKEKNYLLFVGDKISFHLQIATEHLNYAEPLKKSFFNTFITFCHDYQPKLLKAMAKKTKEGKIVITNSENKLCFDNGLEKVYVDYVLKDQPEIKQKVLLGKNLFNVLNGLDCCNISILIFAYHINLCFTSKDYFFSSIICATEKNG